MSEPQPTHDFLGRKIVNSKTEAFKHDLPWIIALIGVTIFTIMALAGYFRL
ncbi:hypothetical protein ACLF3G_02515 [Falsiroseomonas sp. HC035]|uniref:hypothetical protein n=1 Tax=Falsiroseomonas sp. HC035 TaxID=3390999 RepID=UPI003D31D6FA